MGPTSDEGQPGETTLPRQHNRGEWRTRMLRSPTESSPTVGRARSSQPTRVAEQPQGQVHRQSDHVVEAAALQR